MAHKVYLIDEHDNKIAVDYQELEEDRIQGINKYAECAVDFDWYLDNGCVTVEDLTNALENGIEAVRKG